MAITVVISSSNGTSLTPSIRRARSRVGTYTGYLVVELRGVKTHHVDDFCYLTNDQSEFLEECRLQDLVKMHNDFIFVSLQHGREHRHPSLLARLPM
mmetsp:Transcript_143800/g.460342  ORF Transcript_143800/g.460342 Transcript_143800/m.460342 type:complete len:97 (+) Transcript_143800:57-347(+)